MNDIIKFLYSHLTVEGCLLGIIMLLLFIMREMAKYWRSDVEHGRSSVETVSKLAEELKRAFKDIEVGFIALKSYMEGVESPRRTKNVHHNK